MVKNFNIIREMYLRYYYLPIEQAESIMLINNDMISKRCDNDRESYFLGRINDSMYKLVKESK